MDLSKVFQIGTDYKDRRSLSGWATRQFAEILFMDKTHPSAAPQIYQLKDIYNPSQDYTGHSNFSSPPSSQDAFLCLGDMLSFDRKKKEVLLKDQSVVSYRHLVVVSGRKQLLSFADDEVASALQALNEALRVKPKIPSSFAIPVKKGVMGDRNCPYTQTTSFEKSVISGNSSIKHIEQLVHPCISGAVPQDVSFELDILNRRLYEVQL